MISSDEKWTILLVDDEEDIRDVLGIALADFGYEVHVAENGAEAMKIFMEINPPIVLTDIKMPGQDGIELLKRVKHENPETEVVMITGHGDMAVAVDSLKHEAADFITKPIDVNAIRIALKRVEDKILMKRKLREYTRNLEELVREKIELQDRLSSLGMMIGTISHGIKGLMTNLDAGIYLLGRGVKRDDRDNMGEGLDIVTTAAGRMKKMILDILLYAKERKLQTSPVDVAAYAGDLADGIESRAKNGNIELVRRFGEVGSFEVDAEFLRSALVNILDNAVDACLCDRSGRKHRIIFGVRRDREDLVFEVRDNGAGMRREAKEKIFDLFYSSKGKKGTGFGLFISNSIIKQHGGLITVKSAKNKGSHFTVKIPKPANPANQQGA